MSFMHLLYLMACRQEQWNSQWCAVF